MEKKELENIGDFFSKKNETISLPAEKEWENIFSGWIDKIDQEKMMLDLFELKLWLESIEEFNSSPYLENLIFKFQTPTERNYEFYVFSLNQVAGRITSLLKELDFKKDKYFLNFEEFIVDKILEGNMDKQFPNLKELYSPESWFYSFRIFLQSFRTLLGEILRIDIVPQRGYLAIKKLYHRELLNNPILISLLKKQFIPRMDKIFQPDISGIIAACKEKTTRKNLGIFFILAFRILKISNFIELNLNKNKYLDMTIPLILSLKKNMEAIIDFNETSLWESLQTDPNLKNELGAVGAIFKNLKLEFKKICEGELPLYFDSETNKMKKRKMIQNIIVISEMAMQEMIESVARLFKPEITGSNIFENYVSRKQKSIEVKKKLVKLHTKINDYFSNKGSIAPSEIFFDINQFMETDLNYLLYKDWNEFLSFYDNLSRTNFSIEFEPTLRAFHAFLTRVLKEIVSDKK
ncbi:MAG: hypothetical protein JXI33_03555 [Candidatus Aminicenantes bacterium]|nr:hypothetical protein [Candidatus Aminicenantes bacterium]